MKTKIWVSRQNLTRCSKCSRHVEIDQHLSTHELSSLRCTFCDGELIQTSRRGATSAHRRPSSPALNTHLLGRHSGRLAAGLLSVGLMIAGCDDDEPITSDMGMQAGGATGGIEIDMGPGEVGMALYGVFPELDMAPEPEPQPDYGVFPDPDQGVPPDEE